MSGRRRATSCCDVGLPTSTTSRRRNVVVLDWLVKLSFRQHSFIGSFFPSWRPRQEVMYAINLKLSWNENDSLARATSNASQEKQTSVPEFYPNLLIAAMHCWWININWYFLSLTILFFDWLTDWARHCILCSFQMLLDNALIKTSLQAHVLCLASYTRPA